MSESELLFGLLGAVLLVAALETVVDYVRKK